jgi:hypothetical protein
MPRNWKNNTILLAQQKNDDDCLYIDPHHIRYYYNDYYWKTAARQCCDRLASSRVCRLPSWKLPTLRRMRPAEYSGLSSARNLPRAMVCTYYYIIHGISCLLFAIEAFMSSTFAESFNESCHIAILVRFNYGKKNSLFIWIESQSYSQYLINSLNLNPLL